MHRLDKRLDRASHRSPTVKGETAQMMINSGHELINGQWVEIPLDRILSDYGGLNSYLDLVNAELGAIGP